MNNNNEVIIKPIHEPMPIFFPSYLFIPPTQRSTIKSIQPKIYPMLLKNNQKKINLKKIIFS